MRPALREQKKNWGNVLAFELLLSLGNAYAYFCLLPKEGEIPALALLALLYLLIAVLVCRDPGGPRQFPPNYLPAEKSLLDLYLTNETHKVCPECIVVQPKRARHCTICRMCVFKYDHHCPWLNNCIGARNIGVFYCFLLVLWVDLVLVLAGIGLRWAFGFRGPEMWIDERVQQGLSLLVTLLDAGFLGPLTLLLWVQTRNLMLNRTTHERFAYTNRDKSDSVSSQVEESSGSCPANCYDMCCASAVSADLPSSRVLDSSLDRPLLASTATS